MGAGFDIGLSGSTSQAIKFGDFNVSRDAKPNWQMWAIIGAVFVAVVVVVLKFWPGKRAS